MAFFLPILAAIGLGVSAVGTAMQMKGQREQAKQSQRLEKLRQRQMNLDAARQKRATIREAIVARSVAVSNAVAQGAEEGSGLQGGIAQISGRATEGLNNIGQSQRIGGSMFDANAKLADAGALTAIGGSVSGFGQQVAGNAETINKVGTYFLNRPRGG